MEINGSSGEKKMKPPISVIILTYNEEKNIQACLESIHDFVEEIFIVDSSSTDKTLEIAKHYTKNIYQHPFETQGKKFNWALDNLPISTDWIMRLDADERVSGELREELYHRLSNLPPQITGLYVKRKVYFMDRFIKHGGYYPIWLLRLWRKDKGRCEELQLTDHIILSEGKTAHLKNDIIDWNKKGLSFWVDKHNGFATRYANELISTQDGSIKELTSINSSLFGSQEKRTRWLRQNFYIRLPLFARCLFYFIYRFFLRFGFLDGKEGLIFHFLQGFWYHFLADAKIYEYQKMIKEDKLKSELVLKI